MQITRNSIETKAGPSEWFTGSVYIDAVAAPSGQSRLSASSVHFTPGARTAWHTHPNGQTIYVTEGVGLAQRRGGPIEVIRPGDRVFFEPGEDHWHGAAPDRFMTHLAMLEVDDEGRQRDLGRARHRRGVRRERRSLSSAPTEGCLPLSSNKYQVSPGASWRLPTSAGSPRRCGTARACRPDRRGAASRSSRSRGRSWRRRRC